MKRKPLILSSLLLAAFVINLDTTIVNVALPTLVRELHASNSQLQWVVDAFNLLFAGLGARGRQPLGPVRAQGDAARGPVRVRAGEPGGRADAMLPAQLIAARAVMGVGAAMVFPSTLSLLTNVFTERRERALAIGLWGAITGVGDRARADRRRLAASAVRLAQHFLRDDADRCDRGRPRRQLRPDLTRPARAADRPCRVRAVDRGDRPARLHDHRGPEPRLGERADDRQLRAHCHPGSGVRRLGAAHRAADARPEPVPESRASRPPAPRSRSRSSRCPGSSSWSLSTSSS